MAVGVFPSPNNYPRKFNKREAKMDEAIRALSATAAASASAVLLGNNDVPAVDIAAAGDLMVERFADVTLTPAQIAASGTAIDLVAAPGSGKYIEVQAVEALMTYGTAAMTESSAIFDIQAQTSANVFYTLDGTGLVDAASGTVRVGGPCGTQGSASALIVVPVNEKVQFKLRSGTATAGTSTGSLKIRVYYRVRPVLA